MNPNEFFGKGGVEQDRKRQKTGTGTLHAASVALKGEFDKQLACESPAP